ncbi:hypothetical protein GCM10007876_20180 [Litoribrevibacter albus]|uniref:Uncharacterized protein n=2 Tax=Litoribrevibacter albus TaxID=1473156 RepID=A0AA37SAC2_9GAMM|nr:hypothetical protein GCM10007876_20180 [Litoribrevibacter albus]
MSNVVNSRLASDSIDKGNLLVEKLEMFHKGHGVYPGQLTDINGITEDQVFTDMGLFNRIPFFYSAKGSDYNLSFPFPGWMLYTYENKSQKWYLDD